MVNEKVGNERQDHGLWPSRLQSRRFPRAGDARDRARPWETNGERELGADLREARTSDGTGETIVRQRRSLRRARVLAFGISSRIEYAVVCCVPRSRLVRPCDRTTR